MMIFSSLLVVTRNGIKGACRVGYGTASVPMCIAVKELCHSKGVRSGPNLLDEPLKGFIVNLADLPW